MDVKEHDGCKTFHVKSKQISGGEITEEIYDAVVVATG